MKLHGLNRSMVCGSMLIAGFIGGGVLGGQEKAMGQMVMRDANKDVTAKEGRRLTLLAVAELRNGDMESLYKRFDKNLQLGISKRKLMRTWYRIAEMVGADMELVKQGKGLEIVEVKDAGGGGLKGGRVFLVVLEGKKTRFTGHRCD